MRREAPAAATVMAVRQAVNHLTMGCAARVVPKLLCCVLLPPVPFSWNLPEGFKFESYTRL